MDFLSAEMAPRTESFKQIEHPSPLGSQTPSVLVQTLLQRTIRRIRDGGQRHRKTVVFSTVNTNEILQNGFSLKHHNHEVADNLRKRSFRLLWT